MKSQYTYQGSADMYPELHRRSDQPVTVLHRIGNVDESEVGPMYRVRFPDGYQHDAFESELDPMPDPDSPAHGTLRAKVG